MQRGDLSHALAEQRKQPDDGRLVPPQADFRNAWAVWRSTVSDRLPESSDQRRVLVGSVYAPSARNDVWLRLQQHFLKQTLGDRYDLAVWLNHVDADLFAGTTVVGIHHGPREN